MSNSTTIAQGAAERKVVWAAWATIAGGLLQVAGGVINPPHTMRPESSALPSERKEQP